MLANRSLLDKFIGDAVPNPLARVVCLAGLSAMIDEVGCGSASHGCEVRQKNDPGRAYTRHELAAVWGYGGVEAISRGVVTPANDNKIVLFVTSKKRPEDTQYQDRLVGDVLLWEGPNDHFAEDRMLDHARRGDEIHVFYRDAHRDAFTYLGPMILYCAQRFDDRPSRFVFQALADGREGRA